LTSFDPLGALRTLVECRVRFIVIGGLGAVLHGSPSRTGDLDICYSRDLENLDSLATALNELGARLRGIDEGVPFRLEAATMGAGDHFTFTTQAGSLDILGLPAGSEGYDQLMRNAVVMELGDGLEVPVASIEDLIAMKQAAGRPKDLIEVEVLGALLEVVEEMEAEQRG
jgi:hypothetical protein